MVKSIFGFIASIALVTAGSARAQTPSGQVVVSQFSQWQVAGTTALTSGANVDVPFTTCLVSGTNKNFSAFTVSVPVKIVDPNNPSIDEVVSPSAVTLNPGSCTVSLSLANAHPIPYYIDLPPFSAR